jgi:hypothetical protein
MHFQTFAEAAWELQATLTPSNGRRLTIDEQYGFNWHFVGDYACREAATEVVGAVLILPAVNSPRDSSDLHSRMPDCCISLDGRLAAAALAECCQRGLAACAIPAAPGRGRNAGTSTGQSQNGDHPGRRDRSAPSRWNRRIATWGLELLAYTRVQGSGRRLSSWRHPHPAQAIMACSRCGAKGRARRRRRR